jgi:hypothetical protein
LGIRSRYVCKGGFTMNIASTRSISQYADHLRQRLLDPDDKIAIFELAQALIAINVDYNIKMRSV